MRVANPMRLCRLLYRLDEEQYAAMTGQVQFMATKCLAALDISLLFPPTRASKGGCAEERLLRNPFIAVNRPRGVAGEHTLAWFLLSRLQSLFCSISRWSTRGQETCLLWSRKTAHNLTPTIASSQKSTSPAAYDRGSPDKKSEGKIAGEGWSKTFL